MTPAEIHEVMADDAFEVVTEHSGIAFVCQATALKTRIDRRGLQAARRQSAALRDVCGYASRREIDFSQSVCEGASDKALAPRRTGADAPW